MPTLHPAWKEAVAEFNRVGFKSGDVLSFDWLYTNFKLTRPTDATPHAVAAKIQFEFLQHMQAFEKELLTKYLVAVRNVRGAGYEVVPPQKQTRWAFREGMREIGRELNKMGNRLSYLDDTSLTVAERKENADAIAKRAQFESMFLKTRRLPKPT